MSKKATKKAKKKTIEVLNLQFPPYVEELKIGDYTFKRVENYKEAFDGMMQLVNSSGSEFNTQIKIGSHQITAIVEIPSEEKKCVLPWENQKLKQLDDILFLLSLFADRHIFKKDWEDDPNIIIISDHRIHHYGGQLSCSIKYESRWKNKETGELKTEKEMSEIPVFDYNQINIGFENTMNKVLKLISSKKWKDHYMQGHFLFLYRDVLNRQIIQKSFLTCWTIWEQIFAIENKKWLPDEEIYKMGADKKIAYMLTNYFAKTLDKEGWKQIKRITKSRNRLVHFGKKMDNVTNKEKDMFIRLTEQLMALVLDLEPSNIFNSAEKLDKFLKGEAL